MKKKRIYNFKDGDMMFASRITGENLLRNVHEISTVQTNWTEDYARKFIDSTDNGIDLYLGIDPKKELRKATKLLHSIEEPALHDLGFLKKVINVHFKKESNNLLKELGYTRYHKNARRGDQEALVRLHYAFRKGMTEEMKNRIVSKGVAPDVIDRIISYAVELNEANISQETLKESSREISHEAVDYFNMIYQEAMDICKIGAAFYVDNPVKKNQFTFSRIVKNMNANRALAEEEQSTDET